MFVGEKSAWQVDDFGGNLPVTQRQFGVMLEGLQRDASGGSGAGRRSGSHRVIGRSDTCSLVARQVSADAFFNPSTSLKDLKRSRLQLQVPYST